MKVRLKSVLWFCASAAGTFVLTSLLLLHPPPHDTGHRGAVLSREAPLPAAVARGGAASAIAALSPCTAGQRCEHAISRTAEDSRFAEPMNAHGAASDAVPLDAAWRRRAEARMLEFDGKSVAPPPAPQSDPADVRRCAAMLDDATFEEQFERVVVDALACGQGEVVFTILDAAYGDMLHGVHTAVARMRAEDRFFYVSLHRGTAVDACLAGYRVVLLKVPPGAGGKAAAKKDAVYLGKYYTALLLAAARVPFWFFEMDVWMLERNKAGSSILDLFRRAAHETNGGVHPEASWALHQDNPYTINVGMYYINARGNSRQLFSATLAYVRANPSAFDQGFINCALKKMSGSRALAFIRQRDNCADDGVAANDTILREIVDAAKGRGGYNYTLVHAAVGASFSIPFVTRDTLAVHILTSAPLTSAFGKKQVARELGLWEGGADYYGIGGARKFVALDGGLGPPSGADDAEAIKDRLSELFAFAWATGRTVILPPVLHRQRRSPAWELVDCHSLDRIGVGWREATFFRNARAAFSAGVTVAKLAFAASRVGAQPHGAPPRWYAAQGSSTRDERLRRLVSVALGDADVRGADVVYVAFDADRGGAVLMPTEPVDGRDAWPADSRRAYHEPAPEDSWLRGFRNQLQWCDYVHRQQRHIHLLASHLDCATQREAAIARQRKLFREKDDPGDFQGCIS